MERTAEQATSQGCLEELGWLGAGFVLPGGSFTFYRHAARRKVGFALLFFLVFTSIITVLATLNVGATMVTGVREIRGAFERGDVPEIVIEDGVATVDATQPLVLLESEEESIIIVLDTTGEYTRIDSERYAQGMLLTRESLHILNQGDYQVIDLDDLNAVFSDDRIEIDKDAVTSAWSGFSIIFSILSFIALAIWHVAIRLGYLLVLALGLWLVIMLLRPGTDFAPVFITGLYAFVPAFYVRHVLGRLNLGFIFLQTMLLVPIWGLALYAALGEQGPDLLIGARRPRLWRALLGLPLLLFLALDGVFTWSWGGWVGLGLGLVTLLALILAGAATQPNAPEV
jgi:hypothetical protein